MYRRILTYLSQWELAHSESGDLRTSILRFVLQLCVAMALLSASLNTINHRPLSNILLPAGLSVLVTVLYFCSKKTAFFYPIKLIFMVLISLIYLPIAWLSSPGSASAMPMYLLFILVVVVLLIERTLEFLIPLCLIAETLCLLRYEALYPERFLAYTDPIYHGFDLSVNFTAIAGGIIVLLTLVNHHFAREHQQLYELSITDQLTGTYNRRYLFRRLEEIHNASIRGHRPYTVIMIDINHFKQVNDQYGHSEGDNVLRRLGSNLKTICRNFDVVARYGGDEFLIILPDTTAKTSEALSDRIQSEFKVIASTYPDIPMALAIGISENKDDDLDALLLEVDNRLYHKKHQMKT